MAKTDFAFHHEIRVRWSETDAQGVVFNARYLDYADVAVTEYWRAVDWQTKADGDPMQFHVRKATVLFEAPILPDELLTITARTAKIGRTSMTTLVEIHGSNAEGKDDLRASIELVSVHVDLATHRPVVLPDWVAQCFLEFDARAMETTI